MLVIFELKLLNVTILISEDLLGALFLIIFQKEHYGKISDEGGIKFQKNSILLCIQGFSRSLITNMKLNFLNYKWPIQYDIPNCNKVT